MNKVGTKKIFAIKVKQITEDNFCKLLSEMDENLL